MELLRSLDLRREALAFVAFFATIPIYSPNLMFDYYLPGFHLVMPNYSAATLLAAALTGIVFLTAALARPSFHSLRFPLVAAGALASITGTVVFIATLSHPVFLPTLAGGVAGLLSGFGATVLVVAWVEYFARYNLKQSILALGTLCVMGTVVSVAQSLLPNTAQFIAFIVLTALGTLGPLVRSWHSPHTRSGQLPASECGSDYGTETYPTTRSADGAPASAVSILKSMLSVILWPFIGFLLFALAMATQKILLLDTVSAESPGTVIGVLLVLPLCFLRSEKPLLPLIYQVFLPIAVSILIILNSFPEQSIMRLVGVGGVYIFFGIIGLVALAAFTAAANAREFSIPLIFGFVIAAFCLAALLGIVLRDTPSIGDNFVAVFVVLCTLYFVCLLIAPGLQAWRTMFTMPNEEQPVRTLHENFESRCVALSNQSSLSQRESEIMSYVGRGYTPAFIAKKLFLSDSTVRSHIKNIYRKMDIHSRQDLLQLIDGAKRN